jgi:hypothetical protein
MVDVFGHLTLYPLVRSHDSHALNLPLSVIMLLDPPPMNCLWRTLSVQLDGMQKCGECPSQSIGPWCRRYLIRTAGRHLTEDARRPIRLPPAPRPADAAGSSERGGTSIPWYQSIGIVRWFSRRPAVSPRRGGGLLKCSPGRTKVRSLPHTGRRAKGPVFRRLRPTDRFCQSPCSPPPRVAIASPHHAPRRPVSRDRPL